MSGYSLLSLLDSTIEISLSKLAAVLVPDRLEGNHLREVVLIAVLLLEGSVNISLRSIEISIVFCIEGVPEA